MKIIQISDCHLLPPGETMFGSDPGERLRQCIADVNYNNGDADLCILTGDLVHNPNYLAYAAFKNCLRDLTLPFRLLMGNHDERSALRTAFPDTPIDENGFVQSVLDTKAGRLLFLDTAEDGAHTGAYCERRQKWLRERIAESDAPLYVFAHHPPFAIELPHIDQYRMLDGAANALGDILTGARRVRHFFCGHVHRPVCGSWRGIPFSALRGTNHQCWLDFTARRHNVCSLEPPAYAVIFLAAERTIVHFHDFLDDSPKYLFDPDAPPMHGIVEGKDPATARSKPIPPGVERVGLDVSPVTTAGVRPAASYAAGPAHE